MYVFTKEKTRTMDKSGVNYGQKWGELWTKVG